MKNRDKQISELEKHLRDNVDDLESWAVLGDLWLEKEHSRGKIISLTLKMNSIKNKDEIDEIVRKINLTPMHPISEMDFPKSEDYYIQEIRYGYVWGIFVKEFLKLGNILNEYGLRMVQDIHIKKFVSISSCIICQEYNPYCKPYCKINFPKKKPVFYLCYSCKCQFHDILSAHDFNRYNFYLK